MRKLVLENNRALTRLPEDITGLRGLQELQVINSPLQTVPFNINNLSSLASLRLSGGTYERLPPNFAGLANLKTLQITHSRASQDGRRQGLQVLPDDLARLKNLERVDISHHPLLAAVPDGLGRLHKLRELKLSDCPRLAQVPDLNQLQRLETLDLSGNTGLLRLPDLSRLTGLRRIRLAGCEKLQSPLDQVKLRKLRQLEELDLSGCTGMHRLFAAGLLDQIRNRVPQDCRIILHPRQREWNDKLAPFAAEGGAHRLLQWMEAACSLGLDDRAARKMDEIVAAAVASSSFRSRLVAFASENIILQRDDDGMTMAHVAPRTSRRVDDAHDLLVEHQVSEPGRTDVEARRILMDAIRERCPSRLDGNGALHWLAGDEPRPPGTPGWRRRPPWPALAAYVQAHDPEAREIKHRDDDLAILLQEGRGINEGEMLQIVPKMQHIHQAQLHERHVAVAQALLQEESRASGSTNLPRRDR